MLAIVSFIVQSYGAQEVGPVLAQSNGITMANMTASSAMASNLVSAAGFLATMVPLISWGLVKGSIAFTEFITHGIGQSFAAGAAQTMATGNVSLDNFSMDNANMFKWSAAASQAMGQQGTTGYLAGTDGMLEANWQGMKLSANGGSLNPTRNNQNSAAVSEAYSQAQSYKKAEAQQHTVTKSLQDQLAATTAELKGFGVGTSIGSDGKLQFSEGHAASTSAADSTKTNTSNNVTDQEQAKAAIGGDAGVSGGGGAGPGKGGYLPIPKLSGGVDLDKSASQTKNAVSSRDHGTAVDHNVRSDLSEQRSGGESGSRSQSASSGRQAQIQALESKAVGLQDQITKSQQAEQDDKAQYQESLGLATTLSQGTTGSETLEQGQTQVDSAPSGPVTGVNPEATQATIAKHRAAIAAHSAELNQHGTALTAEQQALQAKVQAQQAKDRAAIDTASAATASAASGRIAAVNGAKIVNELNAAGKNVNAQFAAVNGKVDAALAHDPALTSVLSHNKGFLAAGLGLVAAAEAGGAGLNWAASKMGKSPEEVKAMVNSEKSQLKTELEANTNKYMEEGLDSKAAKQKALREIIARATKQAAVDFGEREAKGLAATSAADVLPGVGEAVAGVVTAVNAAETAKDVIGLAIAAKELADNE